MKFQESRSLYIQTPLIYSEPISRVSNSAVWLKLEALQPSGSFKNRGMGRLCQQYAKEGAKCFVSSSGGNAGLAVAYAGKLLNVSVKVVVPETTPNAMKDKIRAEGAEAITYGKNWGESDPYARKMAEEEGTFYIHPFDHPLIWEGNATMMHEVKDEGFKPDAVILSVGGGGFFCGAVQGLRDIGWNDVPVIAVETEGAASFAKAIEKGEIVTLPDIKTIAKSLGASRVAEKALEWTFVHPVISQVVTDRDSLEACIRFSDDHRMLVEPACGATLSVLYKNMPVIWEYKNILALVCGGSGVSRNLIEQWEKETAY
jgi:L-serine/L-threonine ammonia-lyase